MEFDYSADQRALQQEARRFLAAECPVPAVRRVLNDDAVHYDAALWRKLAAQGWTGAAIPQEYGGLGLGAVELGVLAEELGRALAPVPFASTIAQAAAALLLAGTPAQKQAYLPRIADGTLIGCMAITEAAGCLFPETPATRVRGGHATGTKSPVLDGAIADIALVLAQGDDGAVLGVVELDAGVRREVLATVDPSMNAARLHFDDAVFTPLDGGAALLERVLDHAAVFTALQQLGGAEQCLDMAVAFANSREAFGQKIGRYQAVKHKLADLLVGNTLARSHAFHALWALESAPSQVARNAAAALLAASDAYWVAARDTIQIHGAMGYTWEADAHLHYRRAHHLSLSLGGPHRWRDRLFATLAA